ncbi:unnamed protein product [Larinioides sclopetarius]|uniref:Uncharacterized protein n=1 Tax=Larinioides sclopetarius TaxID=280406 RepID=A0AAV1YSB4_9ARAC
MFSDEAVFIKISLGLISQGHQTGFFKVKIFRCFWPNIQENTRSNRYTRKSLNQASFVSGQLYSLIIKFSIKYF